MKNLFKILIPILLFSFTFSLGERNDSFTLKLENSLTDIKGWEFKDTWVPLDNELDRYKLNKIETYSILEKPNFILLVFHTSRRVMMTLVNKDLFIDNEKEEKFNLNNLINDKNRLIPLMVRTKVVVYDNEYSKIDYLFDFFNNTFTVEIYSRRLFIPIYVLDNSVQFLFTTNEDNWLSHIGMEGYSTLKPMINPKCGYSGECDYYKSSDLTRYMGKKYFESSLDEFKKIFLID